MGEYIMVVIYSGDWVPPGVPVSIKVKSDLSSVIRIWQSFRKVKETNECHTVQFNRVEWLDQVLVVYTYPFKRKYSFVVLEYMRSNSKLQSCPATYQSFVNRALSVLTHPCSMLYQIKTKRSVPHNTVKRDLGLQGSAPQPPTPSAKKNKKKQGSGIRGKLFQASRF